MCDNGSMRGKEGYNIIMETEEKIIKWHERGENSVHSAHCYQWVSE